MDRPTIFHGKTMENHHFHGKTMENHYFQWENHGKSQFLMGKLWKTHYFNGHFQ